MEIPEIGTVLTDGKKSGILASSREGVLKFFNVIDLKSGEGCELEGNEEMRLCTLRELHEYVKKAYLKAIPTYDSKVMKNYRGKDRVYATSIICFDECRLEFLLLDAKRKNGELVTILPINKDTGELLPISDVACKEMRVATKDEVEFYYESILNAVDAGNK